MLYEDIQKRSSAYHSHSKGIRYNREYDSYFNPIDKSIKLNGFEKIDMTEVDRLIRFLDGFQAFGPLNRGKIQQDILKSALEDVLPTLSELQKLTILDDFEHHKETIRNSFDRLTKFPYVPRSESWAPPDYSVAASKILHTVNPEFFVMWDSAIQHDFMSIIKSHNGRGYAYKFLPEMQRRANEVLCDVMRNENLTDRDRAIRFLKSEGCGHSLAKVLDEYNFAVVKGL